MSIEVRNLTKRFGAFTALDGVSLAIPDGGLTALLGPSGSGKTTLLRIIAGLEFADEGTVLFHGEDATAVHARDRGVGFVFQHYALFRHMTVFENVAFGLRVKPRAERPSRRQIAERVSELLGLVQLEGLAGRYPSELSGGQRQRVALARALAVQPRVLLLDEPFGALDAKVRKELRRWLRRLHDEIHVTSVFVTHDQEEALEVADQVVVMNRGRIEQAGSPEEVYHRAATSFVYHFLGNVNLFHGRVAEGVVRVGGREVEAPQWEAFPGTAAVGYARPHELEVSREALGPGEVTAVVGHVRAAGPTVRLELAAVGSDEPLEAELTQERYRELALAAGDTVYVRPRELKVFVNDFCI
ncbi:MAG: sulfate ABC transporter ATP-binding protein [Deferrisomatales bacterium]|nr:sulfate ABC transporter ATP-binding protein [Deferrisomatales bacterium]